MINTTRAGWRICYDWGCCRPGTFTRRSTGRSWDLLRKRGQWVRQKTAVVLSLESLLARLTGQRFSLNQIRQLTPAAVAALVPAPEHELSVTSSLTVLRCVEAQITEVERAVRAQAGPRPGFALLQTVTGIGPRSASTILLETGDIRRFTTVGQFASYCRCVSSQYLSNGKRKGAGNTKERQQVSQLGVL